MRRPTLSFRHLFSWIIISIIVVSPMAMGIFPIFPASIIILILLIFSLISFSGISIFSHAKKVSIVILSISFAITLSDFVLRPIAARLAVYKPQDLFLVERSEVPLVYKYIENITYQTQLRGDLSQTSGSQDLGESREIRFVTDSFGFRNEVSEEEQQKYYPDMILLGDSFGEGVNTSQRDTWCSVLAQSYGLKTYNLSVIGSSPWQEYMNFSLEINRLKTHQGTILVWALFTGNDLDDYYGSLNKAQLSWRNRLDNFIHTFKTFRYRSPLRNLFLRTGSRSVITRDFLDERKLLFYVPYIQVKDRTVDEISKHPNYEKLKATVRAMKQLTDEKQLTLAIVLLPSKEEVYSWVLEQRQPWSTDREPSAFAIVLQELTRQERIFFLDMKPHMVEASRRVYEETGDLLWWRDDTHWNKAGHKVAASVVFDQVWLKLNSNGLTNPH